MGEIQGTPQYKIAKSVITDTLSKELETHYNKIQNYVDSYNNIKYTLHRLSNEFSPEVDFQNKFNSLVENITDYIPDLETQADGSNIFLSHVKDIIGADFEAFGESSELLDLLNVSSLDDLQSLESIPGAFLDSASQELINSSFQSIMTDFNLSEVGMGSILAIADHNLNIADIQGSIDGVLNISENLVGNFSDFANLEGIQSMLDNVTNTLGDLPLDKLGNLNLEQMLTDIGIPGLDDITNILNVKDLMSGVLGNITGQITGVLEGVAGCGCPAAVGAGIGDLSGVMDNLANKFMGKLNSTMQSILEDLPIGEFAEVGDMVESIQGQLENMKNIDLPWKELIST